MYWETQLELWTGFVSLSVLDLVLARTDCTYGYSPSPVRQE